MSSHPIVNTNPGLVFLGLVAGIVSFSAISAPVVNGTIATTTDTALIYKASSNLFTSDTVPSAPVNGPYFHIPKLAPDPDGNVDWSFSVRHQATSFAAANATGVEIYLKGTHHTAPHAGENPNNNLPEIKTPAIDIPVWRSAEAFTYGGIPHSSHWDGYWVNANLGYAVVGDAATVGGKVHVGAKHQPTIPKVSKRIHATLIAKKTASNNKPNSTVNFDASTQVLSFSPGIINVLDVVGGASNDIASKYAGDPILDASMTVTPLTLLNIDHDGIAHFSGGTVRIQNTDGSLWLNASFQEFLIGDTSRSDWLDSFAVLTGLDTYDATAGSSFLDDFLSTHFIDNFVDNEWVDFFTEVSAFPLGDEPHDHRDQGFIVGFAGIAANNTKTLSPDLFGEGAAHIGEGVFVGVV